MLPLLIMAGMSLMSAKDQSEAGSAQYLESKRAAVMARIAARQKAEDIRSGGESFASQQRASYAKSGVLFDSGSPLLAMMDTVVSAERNALRTESGGEEQNRALSIQGQTQLAVASAAATSTIVSGVGSALTMYGKAQAGAYKPPTTTEN